MPGVVMSSFSKRTLKSLRRIVTDVTEQTKAVGRTQIATRLTARAAYLLTSEMYEEDLVGYIHSRWFRGPRGGKVRNNSALGTNDVLAIHATGGVIRPAKGDWLFIPLIKGRAWTAREYMRRIHENADRWAMGFRHVKYKTRSIEFIPLGGNRVLVRLKKTGHNIGLLVKSVRIPKRLDFDEVKKRALRDLTLGARGAFVET